MTSKLVVNTIEADTGISSVSFASSISLSSTSVFHFGDAGVNIGADTNISRAGNGILAFNINSSEKVRITSAGKVGINSTSPTYALEVDGGTQNTVIAARSSDAKAAISFLDNTSNGYGRATIGGEGDEVYITSGAGVERLRIKSDGDIVATGNLKTNNISGHNIVHNGAFNINQRGVTSSTSTGFKTLDRWRASWGGNSAPITQKHETLTSGAPYDAGFRHSYKIESNGHSGNNQAYCYIVQTIEAQDIATSGWDYTSSSSYINLSFWIKANVSQNYLMYLHTNDTTIKEYCFLLNLTANQWTKVTKSIPGNSGIVMNNDNGVGLQLWYSAYLGDYYTSGSTVETWQTHAGYTSRPDMPSTWWTQSNATFEITGVQLEVGSTDTPFQHRSYEEELALCQRYAFRIGGLGKNYQLVGNGFVGMNGSTRCAKIAVHLPVTMRTNPSVSNVGTNDTFFGDVGSGSNMTCHVTSNTGGIWADASDGNVVWLDFGRSAGGTPSEGTAVVVYKAGSSGGEILLSAEI